MSRAPIIVLLLFFSLNGCGLGSLSGSCENSARKILSSPNGERKAVIFERGCGATVGAITGISVLPAELQLDNDASGNVLLADAAFQQEGEEVNFDVEWHSNTKLVVRYTQSKFLRTNLEAEGVAIKFEEIKHWYEH